ncbi:MAG: LapA family protein [Nitrospirae bacterium]|nr:LapA family protein [Nitrospirota bacterium]
MLRLIFALIIVIIFAIMAITNTELVQINYILGSTSPLPLYLVLIISFLASGCLYTLILLPSWIHDKMEIRRLRRRLKDLEETRG